MNSEFQKLLGELNPEQKAAVEAPPGPLLIVAGAGSGKTRVLTLRAAHLIESGIPSFQVLAVTFTNKAAAEMKSRLERLIQRDVWVSTFHSTCLRILRQDGLHIGLKRNFNIYDDYDQLVLIKECLDELGQNERSLNPKGIREAIQRAKDDLRSCEAFSAQASDAFETVAGKVYELYEKKLRALNACDFGDLIFKTVRLFDEHPEILRSWRERFRHVLIDEYQDTNHAQYRFARHLAQESGNLTVVGDPDQSIYAWRGADIRNIMSFEKDYPVCRVIKLEQNYRSSANILDGANALIGFNTFRKPKVLWTNRAAGAKIALYEANDEKDEADFVVRDILEKRRKGKGLADCAVFYRLHAQSRVLEESLRRYKVPYRIFGGIRFYDRKEIKDLIAYLKVIAYDEDGLSFKRIANVPSRGIGKKTLEAFEFYGAARSLNWYRTLKASDEIPAIGLKAKETFFKLGRTIDLLRLKKSDCLASELLDAVLNETGYLKALELERTFESKVRLENIQEFYSAVQDFEESWEPEGEAASEPIEKERYGGLLEAFLESITLVTDLDSWEEGTESLTLMTLHSAKGLEFPVVYLVGMEEEIFPHVNSFGVDEAGLEEERRLCYVGMTRAKEQLILSYANSRRLYGSSKHYVPSRFLNEIPPALFERELSGFDSDSKNEEPVALNLDETKRRILFD